jgi:hypothetical protein
MKSLSERAIDFPRHYSLLYQLLSNCRALSRLTQEPSYTEAIQDHFNFQFPFIDQTSLEFAVMSKTDLCRVPNILKLLLLTPALEKGTLTPQ